MSYCPKCRLLQSGAETVCKDCGETLRTPQPEDKVLLVADKERDLVPLCSELSAKDIAFELDGKRISVSSYKSMSGGNLAQVFVPYRCYEEAKAAAETKGYHFPDDITVTPLDDAARISAAAAQSAAGAGSKQEQKQEEELSPAKKRLGRLLLFLSVIAVVAGVVFFSDTIIGFVQGLFNK